MHLASGQLALANVALFVADADLACEPLSIGLPVLQQLEVNTRTMLEKNQAVLDGDDWFHIGNMTTEDQGGTVSRMMIARLNSIGTAEDADDNGTKHQTDWPRVNYQTARTEEDPFPDPSLLDPIGSDQHNDIRTYEASMKKSAEDSGLPWEYRKTMFELVNERTDVICNAFSAGPAAKNPPLKVHLMLNADTVKARLHYYSRDQRDFLKQLVATLVRDNMAYANPTSPWACAPLLVPKPGPEVRYRFTVDHRPVNRFTVKHQSPIPNLEHEPTRLSNSRYYATFDLSHCYLQVELDGTSQALQSFITPDGPYFPTRVMHGPTNAVTHLQAAFSEILPTGLTSDLLNWLDDIQLYDPTVLGLLKFIRQLLGLCVRKNIKLSPAKCILFAVSLQWCGRLVSTDGIRYDPSGLDGLLQMKPPTIAAHLQ